MLTCMKLLVARAARGSTRPGWTLLTISFLISARQPARQKLARHPIGTRIDLAEGERAERAVSAGVFESDAIGAPAKGEFEELGEVHGGDVVAPTLRALRAGVHWGIRAQRWRLRRRNHARPGAYDYVPAVRCKMSRIAAHANVWCVTPARSNPA